MNNPGGESVDLNSGLLGLCFPVKDGASLRLDQKGNVSVTVVIEELGDNW